MYAQPLTQTGSECCSLQSRVAGACGRRCDMCHRASRGYESQARRSQRCRIISLLPSILHHLRPTSAPPPLSLCCST